MSDAAPQPSWRIEKAGRFLLAAQRAFESQDWETAVSRAYYAVYHAVIALLEQKTDLDIPRRHPQLHNLMRSSLFPPLLSSAEIASLAQLYLKRQAADYDEEVPDPGIADECLTRATLVYEKILALVSDG